MESALFWQNVRGAIVIYLRCLVFCYCCKGLTYVFLIDLFSECLPNYYVYTIPC